MYLEWKETPDEYMHDWEYDVGNGAQQIAWIVPRDKYVAWGKYMTDAYNKYPFMAVLNARNYPNDRAAFDTFEEADEWVFLQLVDIRMNGE